MRFVSDSARIMEGATTAYGRYPRAFRSQTDLTVTLTKTVGLDSSAEPVYETTPLLASVHFPGVTRVAVSRDGSAAEGRIAANLLADVPAFRYHVLQFILASMLERHGFLGFHASACVRDGRAILLRGASGSGKTTLAYAAVRQGWQTLGESVLWLDANSEVTCWGMPWWFHLPAAGLRPTFTLNGRERAELDLDAEYPGAAAPSARAAAIVWLERSSYPSRIQRVGREEIAALWPAGASGIETEFPGYYRHVRRLLELPAWRLYFGPDIDVAPALLAPLLTP
ncbi:MAG TPA: hypothetical protein VKB79_17615 [Bryobacteraceae bacterium]|nr:hypothetical protein [Bryobacteraceae bacterium]